jgi:hypothetical protein
VAASDPGGDGRPPTGRGGRGERTRWDRLLPAVSAFYGIGPGDLPSMPTDLFMAYVDQMPRLRAERLLDAAQAALAEHHKPEWWDAQLAAARGDAQEGGTTTGRPSSPFRFNGQPISAQELKRELASSLGAGFSEAA